MLLFIINLIYSIINVYPIPKILSVESLAKQLKK
jgi:hypothetical protein